MNDLLSEKRLSLNALARREDVNVSTVWRWASRGVRGVILESFAVGGRRFTTLEAFARFVERTTAAATGDAQTQRANPQREAAIKQAEADLARQGI